jgi:hypothetical protein
MDRMNGRNLYGQFVTGSEAAVMAGAAGGRTTFERYGRGHMAAIGQRGYLALVKRYGQTGADRILAEGRAKGHQAAWNREVASMADYLEEMGGDRGWRPEGT